MRFAVIIPTRNREELLQDLLVNLSACHNAENLHVIIIDSSDEVFRINEDFPFTLKVIHTRIRSAALQRNMGLNELEISGDFAVDFVAFLDDDIRVNSDYFKRIEVGFELLPHAVGISGITAILSAPSLRVLKRFFGIYGKQGEISKGGVNVPFEFDNHKSDYFQANWLIGCSVWRYPAIKEHRFQADFMGQSLFEDVIFSFEMSKIGKLYVTPSIIIEHLESSIGRPNSYRHSYDWIANRYRLFELYGDEFRKVNFWFANFGKLAYEVFLLLKERNTVRVKSILGLIAGGLKVLLK